MTVAELKQSLDLTRPRRAGHRIPADLRRALLEHVAQARSHGVAWTALAEQTGIRATSLARMVTAERLRTQPSPLPTLVPVLTATPAPTPASLSLHLPSGAEVRGLDLPTLVAVLRALA